MRIFKGTSKSCPNIFDFESYGDMGDKDVHKAMIVHDVVYSDLFSDDEWVKYKYVNNLKTTSGYKLDSQ